MILLGFGGLLVFVALVALKKGLRSETSSNAFTLLVTWALVNIAVSFIPISFQRKMIMGAHIPIAMIAGIAVFELTKKLEGRKWQVAVGLICLGFSMTNIRFVLRDIDHLPVNEPGVRSYLYAGELKSLQWIRDNGQPGPIQPLPWAAMADNGRVTFFDNSVACYAPGVTGRAVNAGHWGETPEFGKTMNRWANFIRADIDDSYRQQLLISTGVKYILFSQKHDETGRQEMNDQLLSIFRSGGLPYLHKIAEASNEDCDVYSVDL